MGRKGEFKDLTGLTFGRLTVRRIDHVTPTKYRLVRYWFCTCECGGTNVVPHACLVRSKNRTSSCGCIVKEINRSYDRRSKNFVIGAPFGRLLQVYKTVAKRRGLSWELSNEQFKELTSSACYYSGVKPSKSIVFKSGEKYMYNGIDRVDNSIGYTISNCVPCCHEINMMKKTLSKEHFIELCKKIAERF